MSDPTPSIPFPASYWVDPGRFLAGEYPATRYFDEKTRTRLGNLLDCGVTCIFDLTEEGELPSYQKILQEQAGWRGVEVTTQRFPIQNFGLPTRQQMKEILNALDAALERGQGVYVHCWGGIGRTGTVVGCWLVRHGLSGKAALKRIEKLRIEVPGGYTSPETDAQMEFVEYWKE